jgi:hypothetical protein
MEPFALSDAGRDALGYIGAYAACNSRAASAAVLHNILQAVVSHLTMNARFLSFEEVT